MSASRATRRSISYTKNLSSRWLGLLTVTMVALAWTPRAGAGGVGRPNPDPELGLGGVAGPLVQPCNSVADCSDFGLIPNVDCIPDADGFFPGTCYVSSSRYLSITPNPDNAGSTARRVTFDSNFNGQYDAGIDEVIGWFAAPLLVDVSGPEPSPQLVSPIGSSSVYRDWNTVSGVPSGTAVRLSGCGITPSGAFPETIGNAYFIQAINLGDDENNEGNYSAPLRLLTTTRHADVVGAGFGGNYPNQTTSIGDTFAILLGWEDTQVVPKWRLDVTGNLLIVDQQDVDEAVLSFQMGGAYPGPQPLDCPGISRPNPDPELGLGGVAGSLVQPCNSLADCSDFGVLPNVDCIPNADGFFPGTCYVSSSRYLSIAPNLDNAGPTARRVTFDSNFNGQYDAGVDEVLGWFAAPLLVDVTGPEPSPQLVSPIGSSSVYRDWNTVSGVPSGTAVRLSGCGIVPKGAPPETIGNAYFIQAINLGDDENDEGNYSAPLRLLTTTRHADVVGAGLGGNYPNQAISLPDTFAIILGLQDTQLIPKWRLDVTGNLLIVNQQDVDEAVLSFQTDGAYPGPQPLDCPGISRPNPDPVIDVEGTTFACSTDVDCPGETYCIPEADGTSPSVCYAPANRYLSILPNPHNTDPTARRVSIDTNGNGLLDPGIDIVLGWVGDPFATSVTGPEASPQAQSRVSQTSLYRDWNDLTDVDPDLTGAVAVRMGDCEISPGYFYFVQAINLGDDQGNENNYSLPLTLRTVAVWADVIGPSNAPDGIVMMEDPDAIVAGFQGSQTIPKYRLELTGGQVIDNVPNFSAVNIADVLDASAAMAGAAYPYDAPCDCPGQPCSDEIDVVPCCLPGGSCAVISVASCAASGTPVDECLGDGNDNGVDDACCASVEQPQLENKLGLDCAIDADCPNLSVCVDGECYVPKNKYISLRPGNPGELVALRVTMIANSLFPALVGSSWWVTPSTGNEPDETFRLDCEEWYQDWSEAPTVIHVGDSAITSGAVYRVEAVHTGCDITDPAMYSPPLDLPTVALFGDCIGPFDGAYSPPDGTVNLEDVFAAIQAFQGLPSAPNREWVDVDGDVPNAVVNLGDAFAIVIAFQNGGVYPYPEPIPCP